MECDGPLHDPTMNGRQRKTTCSRVSVVSVGFRQLIYLFKWHPLSHWHLLASQQQGFHLVSATDTKCVNPRNWMRTASSFLDWLQQTWTSLTLICSLTLLLVPLPASIGKYHRSRRHWKLGPASLRRGQGLHARGVEQIRALHCSAEGPAIWSTKLGLQPQETSTQTNWNNWNNSNNSHNSNSPNSPNNYK